MVIMEKGKSVSGFEKRGFMEEKSFNESKEESFHFLKFEKSLKP